jgi:hypothetical protein
MMFDLLRDGYQNNLLMAKRRSHLYHEKEDEVGDLAYYEVKRSVNHRVEKVTPWERLEDLIPSLTADFCSILLLTLPGARQWRS